MTISVVLVDDNLLFRKTVAEYLRTVPDIQIVGEANNGMDAQVQVLAVNPQVLVMDWMMPRMGGWEALRLLRLEAPWVRVIVLSMHADEVHVQNAVQNGARGYVLKEDTVDHLPRAIRAVARGERYFSPRLEPLIPQSC